MNFFVVAQTWVKPNVQNAQRRLLRSKQLRNRRYSAYQLGIESAWYRGSDRHMTLLSGFDFEGLLGMRKLSAIWVLRSFTIDYKRNFVITLNEPGNKHECTYDNQSELSSSQNRGFSPCQSALRKPRCHSDIFLGYM